MLVRGVPRVCWALVRELWLTIRHVPAVLHTDSDDDLALEDEGEQRVRRRRLLEPQAGSSADKPDGEYVRGLSIPQLDIDTYVQDEDEQQLENLEDTKGAYALLYQTLGCDCML